ncbi:transposable element Tcb1 transposase [Trichonephila clavipes]|nr:transposable element Tcb1 transposase [Trichonephila clavipes]
MFGRRIAARQPPPTSLHELRRALLDEWEDRYVALVPKMNRKFTPDQIPVNLATATGTHVSARTISQRINHVGLYARKPIRCIPLQPRYCRQRLHWCNVHIRWDPPNWSGVLFSDEFCFKMT